MTDHCPTLWDHPIRWRTTTLLHQATQSVKNQCPTLLGHTVRWKTSVLLHQATQSGAQTPIPPSPSNQSGESSLSYFMRPSNQVKDHCPTLSGHPIRSTVTNPSFTRQPIRWEITVPTLLQHFELGERLFFSAFSVLIVMYYCALYGSIVWCFCWCSVLHWHSVTVQSQEDSNTNQDVYVPNSSCQDWDKYEWIGKLMGACFRSRENLVSWSVMRICLLLR